MKKSSIILCFAGIVAMMSCTDLSTAYKDNIPGLVSLARTGFLLEEPMNMGEPVEIDLCIAKGGMKDQETTVSFSVSQSLLDSLNNANGTNYLALPADCYEMPAPVALAKGVERACGSIRYFPDKIARLSGYGVTKYVLPLVARANGLPLNANKSSVLYGFYVKPNMLVSPEISEMTFSFDGKTATANGVVKPPVFAVTTTLEGWKVVSDQTWLTATQTASGFTLEAAANPFGSTRAALVTVKVDQINLFTIRVTQQFKTSMTWNNITADVLKNTEEPFRRGTDLVVHLGGTRYIYQIEDWTVNAAQAVHGTVVDNGIDVRNIISLRTINGQSNPETITNGKMYQTVELEAGTYRFDVHTHYFDKGAMFNVYSAAALGNDLPDTNAVSNALGFANLKHPDELNQSGYYTYPVISFEFFVSEKSEVSLGFVVTVNHAVIYIWKVELWAYR